jgi:ectoine hydroxylase-related dioxygenase (phytanoyl-CoA dioxygenase family)
MPTLRYNRREQHGFIEAVYSKPLTHCDVTIRAIDSKGQTFKATHRVGDTPAKSVFLNSYFLGDGNYDLEFASEDIHNSRISSRRFTCNICNGSSELANRLRKEFKDSQCSPIVVNTLDSSYFASLPTDTRHSNVPTLIRGDNKARALSPDQLSSFDEHGYIILEQFYSADTISAAKRVLDKVNANELYGFKQKSSNRIVNLHEKYSELRNIYSHPGLYDVVSDLFGVQALPCQSLTFINGSIQDAHQDTIHLTPFPRGLMCGIWIALEDVIEGAGELFLYPGSHTLPAVLCASHGVPKVDPEKYEYTAFGEVFTPAIQALLSSNPHLNSKKFLAKAGDVLIWQENLIHGGAPRLDPDQTRMSMVIHAFGEPALVYYDSLGISGKRDIL